MTTDATLTPVQAPPLAYVRHGVLNVLANRSDFLRTASARRQATASFLLQARDRRDGNPIVRIGFTASKKVGNAVLRAKAKRRLRAIARDLLGQNGQTGWDYVLVARPEATISRVYTDMSQDLAVAFKQIHKERPPRPKTDAKPK